MREALERLTGVMDRTGLPRSTLYAMMKQGKFPRSIRVADRITAWYSKDVDQWIKDTVTQSRERDLEEGEL